jgi:hypothetical protein
MAVIHRNIRLLNVALPLLFIIEIPSHFLTSWLATIADAHLACLSPCIRVHT